MSRTKITKVPVVVLFHHRLNPLDKEVLEYNNLKTDTELIYRTMCDLSLLERNIWPTHPCVGNDALKYWGLKSPFDMFNPVTAKLEVRLVTYDNNVETQGLLLQRIEVSLPYKHLTTEDFNLLVKEKFNNLKPNQLSFIQNQVDTSCCYEEQLQQMVSLKEDMVRSGLI